MPPTMSAVHTEHVETEERVAFKSRSRRQRVTRSTANYHKYPSPQVTHEERHTVLVLVHQGVQAVEANSPLIHRSE